MKKRIMIFLLAVMVALSAGTQVFAAGVDQEEIQLVDDVEVEEEEAEIPVSVQVSDQGSLEEDLSSKKKIIIALPQELAGFSVQLKDSEGALIDVSQIDPVGSASIRFPESLNNCKLIVNTDKPISLGYEEDEKTSFGIFQIILISGFVGAACFLIGSRHKEKKLMPKILEIREFVHVQGLD